MRAAQREAQREAQLAIEFPVKKTWGGKRAGSGRKKRPRANVPRRTRADFYGRHPILVTLRVRKEAAGLRRSRLHKEIRAAVRRCGHKAAFRICHYSIQGNHLHLICEADDRESLARGVQGFASLVARRINASRGGRGKVFEDRYHARALTTPTEVRNALCYVLNNWRHHKYDRKDWATDPFSSGALFDGWSDAPAEEQPLWLPDDEAIPIAAPAWWLLREGWRRGGGLLSTKAVPGEHA